MVGITTAGKQALDQLIAHASDDPLLPSFVFGVSNAEGEIYVKAHGLQEPSDPSSGSVGPDSVFWLCSQTKLLIHIAGLKLLEQGKVSLEDPVADYIPELKNPVIIDNLMAPANFVPAKNIMRYKHLLNHSAGFYYPIVNAVPDGIPVELSSTCDKKDPVQEFFKAVKGDFPGVPLVFEPGTEWAYGWSSDVIGFIIEKVTGATLEEYLKEHILGPLDLSQTSFFLAPEMKANKVGYWIRREGKLEPFGTDVKLYQTDPSKLTGQFGGVGMYSSARDYLTLLRHLLQVKAGTAMKPILGPEYFSTLFQPSISEKGQKALEGLYSYMAHSPGEGQHWGNGLVISTKDWPGRRKAGSQMWGGWANTIHFVDPTTGVAVVFMTQSIGMMDEPILKCLKELETALYSGLE